MKRNRLYITTLVSIVCGLLWACRPDDGITPPSALYDPSPYAFNRPELEGPNRLFPTMVIPSNNPMTSAKVELGRYLFYDSKLSVSGNQSCNSCHKQEYNFGDNVALSTNASGSRNSRNAMPLVNLGWANNGLMWDGRTIDLEAASADAIFSELHSNPSAIIDILNGDSLYTNLFAKAFEDGAVTLENINKSLASFMRSIVSIDSKYDRYVKFGLNELSQEEFRGFEMVFSSEEGDCFHCHASSDVLFSDFSFHNIGLDSNIISIYDFADYGLGGITGNEESYGLFKTPSLRNWAYSPPYMHDGRFTTMEEVVEFHSTGLKTSPNLDVIMLKDGKIQNGGLQMTTEEKSDLLAFLQTLNDTAFLNNTAYSNPFE